ncbi:hypothetical protein PRZ48_007405 [Zasmidium cellare]|uniref:Uncharacterized protein n=1 Tax=Zasmidium cellare TaxID=395010 RepID=A0ABR0EJZ1_ZASCE|nr:hypothetical protein PRZ48_007405 [Zasmidium cellare]
MSNNTNGTTSGSTFNRISGERNIPVDNNDPAAVARLLVDRFPRGGPIVVVLSRFGQEPSPAWRDAVHGHMCAMRPDQEVVVYTRNEFRAICGEEPPSVQSAFASFTIAVLVTRLFSHQFWSHHQVRLAEGQSVEEDVLYGYKKIRQSSRMLQGLVGLPTKEWGRPNSHQLFPDAS